MTDYPVLYSFRRCPYAMRARSALFVSETCCVLREIRIAAKPEAMLAASPKGTVPVLVLPGGDVIDESLDIMRWALSRRDSQGWLERDDNALIVENDGPFKQNLDRYKYPERFNSDMRVHRDSGLGFLQRLDERLAHEGYLSGTAFGLTDAAIAPFVRQFAAVDNAWFSTLPLPHVQAWLSDYLASNLFDRIMTRVPPWQASDAPVLFPAAQGTVNP